MSSKANPKTRRSFDPGWILALLLPSIAVFSLLSAENLPWTADGLFHTHRIQAMTLLMRQGDLYPRWIPWFHLGYGYPVFNFYAPLGTWLGGLLGLLGVDAVSAFKLLTAGLWLFGSAGLYALARRWLPTLASLLVVTFWAYAPTRMHEYWIQGSLAHVVATALLPWLFWAFAALMQQPSRRRSVLFALTIAALLLAHQPTAYLAALALALTFAAMSLSWLLRDHEAFWPRLWATLGAVLLGAGLAAVFLLPMLLESALITVQDLSRNIPGILRENFIALDQLFRQPALLDSSDLSATIPHSYGLIPAILALLGVLALWRQRRFWLLILLLLTFGLSVVLILSISEFIWLNLPLMGQLRFPWRVLRLGIVPLALLGGASLLLIPQRWRSVAAGLALLVVIGSALQTVYPTGRSVDYSDLSAVDMIRYEVETGALGGTSYNEFKPGWGHQTPDDPPANIDDYAAQPFRIEIAHAAESTSIARQGDAAFSIDSPQPGEIVFRQFYFPGWQVTLDGVHIETSAESEYGLLQVEIPAGTHEVELSYRGTTIQHLAVFISLASLLIALLLLRLPPSEASFTGQGAEPDLTPRTFWTLVTMLLGFALINAIFIQPETSWFRQQSPPDSPAAMETRLDIDFEDAYTLLGYTLPKRSVEAGDTLDLTLFWRARRPLKQAHGPRLQVQNLRHTEAWAALEPPFIGTNPIVHNPDHFVSQDYQLRIVADAPPYIGQISVQLIDAESGSPLHTAEGSEVVYLPDLIEIHAPTQPSEARLNYRVEDRIELQCASVTRTGDGLHLDLIWQVDAALDSDPVTTFVHGLDENGELVNQADALPLDGNYPPALWRSGQTLRDSYVLEDDPDITQVAVGLYTAEHRLSITQDGQPVVDNRVLLPIGEAPCR